MKIHRTIGHSWVSKVALGGRAARAAAAALGGATLAAAHATPVSLDVKPAAQPVVKTTAPARELATPGAFAPATGESRAQSRTPARRDPSVMSFGTGADGSIWARGLGYKLGVDASGATYVPFLGKRAAAHPIRMRVAGVLAGGADVAAGSAASFERSGERIVLARGGFDEVFDVRPDGVEQSFVFETLPRDGEVRLTLGLDTDLASRDSDFGIELANADGFVRFGRAEAFDAAGRRAPVETRRVEGGLELTVAASFVAGATFPLTIDPLITSFAIDDSDFDDDYGADVSYDAATDRYVTVFEETFGANDHDVFAAITDANGGHLGTFSIDVSSADWRRPRVANNAIASQFFVVGQVGPVNGRTIEGRTLEADDFVMGPPIVLSAFASGEHVNPDVGGDSNPNGPTYYCVTWERVFDTYDHDVLAQLCDANGVLLNGTIEVDSTAGTLDTAPSISSSDGNAPDTSQNWTIVWQRRFGDGDEDIRGAQIHWNGPITTSSFSIDSSFENDLHPTVSSILDTGVGGRRYLVAWERRTPGPDSDIFVAFLNGASLIATTNLTSLETYWAVNDQLQPTADSDGSKFAVAYSEKSLLGGDYDIFAADVYCAGNTIGLHEAHAPLGTMFGDEQDPKIVSTRSSGGLAQRYMVVWDVNDGGQRDIEGALFATALGGPMSSYCHGSDANCPCGNGGDMGNGCANSANPGGAHLTAAGAASVVADSVGLLGSGMPNGATSLFFQGTSMTGAAFGDGLRCVTGSVVRLGTKMATGGTAQFPETGDPRVSVKGGIDADGATRFYQIWYRNAASFCTASTFNLSNGLRIVWVP